MSQPNPPQDTNPSSSPDEPQPGGQTIDFIEPEPDSHGSGTNEPKRKSTSDPENQPQPETVEERKNENTVESETVEQKPPLAPMVKNDAVRGGPDLTPATPGSQLDTKPEETIDHESSPQLEIEGTKQAPQIAIPGYEILKVLGRGGMGVVYKARHIELDRLVALKMVLAGAHATEDQITRFRTEARAVAQLQHANIVQIYEIGELDGLPYFSLEMVEGGGLDKVLNHTPQPPRPATERARVLAQAMQVAHERNIIHRDLKPANILITPDGNLKITDFGLAKRLEGDSQQTHSGTILGTPSYMPPEQAIGDLEALGPLSDIYSLGAVLYEMLTGRPPFRGASAWETIAQVQNQEPVPPSQLQPSIPKDLETICLKCLNKDPEKRYDDAEKLAEDLQRFLKGEPILARPVSRPERLWRWCRRNPKVAILSASSLMLLVAGLIVSWALTAWALNEQERFKKERDKLLTTSANMAQKVLIALPDVPQTKQYRREVAKIALNGLKTVAEGADPTRKGINMAAVHRHMGNLHVQLGESEKAMAELKECLRILNDHHQRKVLSNPDENFARCYLDMGDAYRSFGDYDKAEEHYKHVLAHQQRDFQLAPTLKNRQDVMTAYGRLGNLWLKRGQPKKAQPFLLNGLKEREKWVAAQPHNHKAHQNLAGAQLAAGDICLQNGDLKTAQDRYRSALKILTDVVKETQADTAGYIGARLNVALAHSKLGIAHLFDGDKDQPLEQFHKAVAIAEKVHNEDTKDARAKSSLGYRLYELAGAYFLKGDNENADRYFQECLKLRRDLLKKDPRSLSKNIQLMVTLARCNEHQEAAVIAAKIEKSKYAKDSGKMYQVACGYALCAAAMQAIEREKPLTEEQKSLKSDYLTKAIRAVESAISNGYDSALMLRKDPDLAFLQDQPDFNAAVEKLERKSLTSKK